MKWQKRQKQEGDAKGQKTDRLKRSVVMNKKPVTMSGHRGGCAFLNLFQHSEKRKQKKLLDMGVAHDESRERQTDCFPQPQAGTSLQRVASCVLCLSPNP